MDTTEFDIEFLTQKLSDNPQSPLFARLADLIIPNEEMMSLFETVILSWFAGDIIDSAYKKMLEALVVGDVSTFDDYFTTVVTRSFDFFDVANEKDKEPPLKETATDDLLNTATWVLKLQEAND